LKDGNYIAALEWDKLMSEEVRKSKNKTSIQVRIKMKSKNITLSEQFQNSIEKS
jgi:hypothetical protein